LTKKNKRAAEKKIVVEQPSNCQKCGKSIGRVMIRAPRSQIPEPISVEFKCLACADVVQPPSLPDQAVGGSSIGTVEIRKRMRVNMEIEDEEAGTNGSRRTFCDVCQRVVGSGCIVGGKQREMMNHMTEIVCESCDRKYQRSVGCLMV
jgi:hypothetical protein